MSRSVGTWGALASAFVPSDFETSSSPSVVPYDRTPQLVTDVPVALWALVGIVQTHITVVEPLLRFRMPDEDLLRPAIAANALARVTYVLPPQHARAYHTCQVGRFRRVYLRSSPNTCIAYRGTYPDTCIARGRLEHPVDESWHARVGVWSKNVKSHWRFARLAARQLSLAVPAA